MVSHNSERGQQNEFGASWSQPSQLQLSSDGGFSTFPNGISDPLAEPVFTEYNMTISSAQRRYTPTATRYQHLNETHLTSSGYVTADAAIHSHLPSFPSGNEIRIDGFPNTQDGSDGTSTAPRPTPATITTTAGTHHDASLGIQLKVGAPTMPTTQRRPRARKPASEKWERHKETIDHLYLKQNLSLMDTMTEMRETHQFYATEKMYKDTFKQWKWSKNLPRDMAVGMLNKAKRRQPKQTIFHWGNQTWTVDRIEKTHGKLVNQPEPNSLADFPTPQGVICETPRGIETSHSPRASEKAQTKDGNDRPAGCCDAHAPRSVGGPIDEGPFHRSLNQSSTADLSSIVEAALEANTNGDEEEAERGLRDALSCSSRLLSSTHEKTVDIGYMLASFYATRRCFVDAYEILNWMTNKHLGSLGASHTKTIDHLHRLLLLLRHWQRNKEANLLIYRLLESLKHIDCVPIIPQISTECETVSKEMIGKLLASSGGDRLAVFLLVLDRLASDSENHEFLQDLMTQVIERCGDFLQEFSSLIIHSRCILAEILVSNAQNERARIILAGCGRPLKARVDSKTLMLPPELDLVRRVAITFLKANDPKMCDKIIKRVVKIFDTDYTVEKNHYYYIFFIDFLLSTAYEMQERWEWERIRPWIERSLSLSYYVFGRHQSQTKRIEHMLEAHKVEQLFLAEDLHDYQYYFQKLLNKSDD